MTLAQAARPAARRNISCPCARQRFASTRNRESRPHHRDVEGAKKSPVMLRCAQPAMSPSATCGRAAIYGRILTAIEIYRRPAVRPLRPWRSQDLTRPPTGRAAGADPRTRAARVGGEQPWCELRAAGERENGSARLEELVGSGRRCRSRAASACRSIGPRRKTGRVTETPTEPCRLEPRTGTLPVCVRRARTRSDASVERNGMVNHVAHRRWRTQGTGFGYSAGVTGYLSAKNPQAVSMIWYTL
jgi:hypothetical protein